MDGWINELMNGWMDKRMDGWMDGWMDDKWNYEWSAIKGCFNNNKKEQIN